MKRWIFLWLSTAVIALIMVLGIGAVLNVHASADTRAFITPAVSYAGLGESFAVDIEAADVTSAHPLYAFYINISFDPDVLQYNGAIEGDFLAEQPDGTVFDCRVEQEMGWVYFGWSTKGAYDGVPGEGTLATVMFNVTALGESSLNITNPNTELIEMQPVGGGHVAVPIACTLENGYFTNVGGVPPIASFTYSPEKPKINEEVTFDASASYDPDDTGYIVSFAWDFGDGATEVYVKDVNLTDTVTHEYAAGGGYSVVLTVTDNTELEGSVTKSVSVRFTHDIAVTKVQVSTKEVTVGGSVSIDVTVLNKGASDESFTVIAFYEENEIGEESVSELEPDGEETVSFVWVTSEVAEGTYSIKASATGVEDDGNLLDNVKFGGDVDVKVAAGFPIEYIIVGVAAVIIIVIGIFVYSRRKR
jgi:PKD repeat protein